MQETLYQTGDAVDCIIRQRMQETLFQTVDAGDIIRQRMQEYLFQTADAGDSLSESGCKRLSIRQRMQENIRQ